MYYSPDLTNDNLENYLHRIDSIPHTAAAEERELCRKYIKWRHINRILTSEGSLGDKREASFIVIKRIIKKISSAHDLIVLLKHHSGLDELGDTIIADDNRNNANIAIELFRLIQQSKKKQHKTKQRNSS